MYFDLGAGAIGSVVGADDQGIDPLGNGWYRCWFTFSTTTDLAGRVLIYVAQTDGSATVDKDGTKMTEYEDLGEKLKWRHNDTKSNTVSSSPSILHSPLPNGVKDES